MIYYAVSSATGVYPLKCFLSTLPSSILSFVKKEGCIIIQKDITMLTTIKSEQQQAAKLLTAILIASTNSKADY